MEVQSDFEKQVRREIKRGESQTSDFPFLKNWHKLAVHGVFSDNHYYENIAIPTDAWFSNAYSAGVAGFYRKYLTPYMRKYYE